MTRYTCTTVKIGGALEFRVEMWTTHNHSTIFNEMNDCLFDGDYLEACTKYKEEVKNLLELAKSYGIEYEVIKTH